MSTRNQEQIRTFVRRRLLSVNPPCSAFRLVYLNDGTQLVQVGTDGTKLEESAEATAVEFDSLASSHGALAPGVHRFRIQALGPAPEERAIGALDVQVITEAPARALVLDNRTAEINAGALPAQLVKLGLDHSLAQTKLLVDTQLRFAALTETQIGRLVERNGALEEKLGLAFEMMERLVLHEHERKTERRAAKAKEKRKDRLVNAVEDLIPAVHERLTGDGKLMELINSIGRDKLALLAENMGPREKKLVDDILTRSAAVETKANKRKAEREKDDGAGSTVVRLLPGGAK